MWDINFRFPCHVDDLYSALAFCSSHSLLLAKTVSRTEETRTAHTRECREQIDCTTGTTETKATNTRHNQ